MTFNHIRGRRPCRDEAHPRGLVEPPKRIELLTYFN